MIKTASGICPGRLFVKPAGDLLCIGSYAILGGDGVFPDGDWSYIMKQLLTQYRGLKKEIYILFVGKLVTAMGSFVWPMLTFFLTTKLGLSDGVSTLLIATASVLSVPAALLGGKLADRFSRKNIINNHSHFSAIVKECCKTIGQNIYRCRRKKA